MSKIFRSSPEVAEFVRLTLDSLWGYPNEITKTLTSFPPADKLKKDESNRVYLIVSQDYYEYEDVQNLLPQLVQSGQIEEITLEQYNTIFPPQKRKLNKGD